MNQNLIEDAKRGGYVSEIMRRLAQLEAEVRKLLAKISGGREILKANRTYYVRTDGSDSNDGLANTADHAFLTFQGAWNAVARLDIGTFTVTIQIADGTYTGGLNATASPANASSPGGGGIVIQGNSATPANVHLSVTNAYAIYFTAPVTLTLKNFKISVAGVGHGIFVNNSLSSLILGVGMDFGSTAWYHIRVVGGYVSCGANYSITGNAQRHIELVLGGRAEYANNTITLVGAIAFSAEFIHLDLIAAGSFFNVTFIGAATGTRYLATMNSVLNTYGGGAAYFPGNVAGSVATGAQYA